MNLQGTVTGSEYREARADILNQKFNDYTLTSALEDLIKQYILASHPIGSIEINISGANPSTYLGGTWIAWGSGKVPVGVNTSDTEFSTVEKTGGSKTHTHTYSHTHGVPGVAHTHTTGNHTLTIAEMPSHTHAFRAVRDVFNSDSNGSLPKANNGQGANSGWSEYVTIAGNYANQNTGGGGAHNHGNTGSTTPSATTTNSQSTSTSGSGGSTTLDITPACEAAYCWKRTA